MRLLKRNTSEFEYLPYDGTETDIDPETGLHTGEYVPEYGDPVTYMGTFSTPSSMVNPTFYGTDIRYTHTLVMDDPKADINEYGLVRYKGELYDIRAVRPSINSLSIALRKQTKDNPDPESDEP